MNGSQKAACLLSAAAILGGACSDSGTPPNPVVTTGGTVVSSGGILQGTGGAIAGTGGVVNMTGGTVVGTGGAIAGTGGVVNMTGGTVVGTGGTVVTAQPCAEQGLEDPSGTCAVSASGVFGLKTVLDVWWDPPGAPAAPSSLVNPGRGKIEIFMVGTIDNVCKQPGAAAGAGFGTIRSCGSRLPAFTSEATCGVMDITIPDEAWEAPTMPSFTTPGTVSNFEPGGILELAMTTAQIGIDMTDPNGTFPTPDTFADITCAAGSGIECYPDHDNNTAPGVTANIANSGEPAPTDIYPPQCGFGDAFDGPYYYRPAPGDGLPDMLGGAVTDPERLVKAVDVGLRLKVGGGGAIDATCTKGTGPATAEALEVIVIDCTLESGQPCSAAQADFIAHQTPTYQILQAGEMPQYTATDIAWPPFSYADTSPSEGAKGGMVRLGDVGANIDCAMVRAQDYGF